MKRRGGAFFPSLQKKAEKSADPRHGRTNTEPEGHESTKHSTDSNPSQTFSLWVVKRMLQELKYIVLTTFSESESSRRRQPWNYCIIDSLRPGLSDNPHFRAQLLTLTLIEYIYACSV